MVIRKTALTQTDPNRMPGDGQIDLQTEIKLLKEKADGTVSLELFSQ